MLGDQPVLIAAGALSMIPVTCPQFPLAEFLLEPMGPEDGTHFFGPFTSRVGHIICPYY